MLPSLAGQPRVIRVFVSSTFRDMQAEREVLIKRVFPAVRARCAERGVTFAEVDLRWGVTDEQKAEGAVLPICLAEIDRCRPYFIGLLGQRYGWVPDSVDAELVRRIGWLSGNTGRSVTELEILHGVLADPAAAGHAYFYLRDPEWVQRQPQPARAELVDTDPGAAAALSDLRGRIRAAPIPSAEYADPDGLGRLVLADLTALVDRLFPAGSAPDPITAAAARHAAHASVRAEAVFPRPAVTAAVQAHLAGGADVPLVLAGTAGSGVDGLLATVAAAWLAGEPESLLVQHHTAAGPEATDPTDMLRRLVIELQRAAGADAYPERLPDDPLVLRSLLAGALAAAPVPALIVLTLPEHLTDEFAAPDLAFLPDRLPAGVRVLVATRTARAADAARGRGWAVLDVPELTPDERHDFAERYLARFAKALDAERLRRICTAPQTGNELFLATLLDELRQHGDHFTLEDRIADMLRAGDVDDLLGQVLARYERDYDSDRPGLTRALFGAVAASRAGLTEAELAELLSAEPAAGPLPRSALSPLFLAASAAGALIDRDGLVGLGGAEQDTAVRERYLPTELDLRTAHRALASYFASHPDPARRVDELPWQLLAAGDTAALAALVADPDFLQAAYRRSYPDLRRYVAAVEAAGHRVLDGYPAVLADPGSDQDLAWCLARIASDSGHPDQAMPVHRFLARSAARPEVRRAAAVNLGAALWRQGELAAAAEVLTELVEDCRAAGDRAVQRAALGNLALVLRDLGDLDRASELFAQYQAMLTGPADIADRQACLGNQVQILRQRGREEEALALVDVQERLCRSIGDGIGAARAATARGAILADRGSYDQALQAFAEYQRACRAAGDLSGLLEGTLNSADTLRVAGRSDEAGPLLEQAVALGRRLADLPLLSRALTMSALLAADRARWPDCRSAASEAVLLARSAQAVEPLAKALGVLAMAHRELGEPSAAADCAAEQEQIYRGLGDELGAAVARVERGNAAAVLGDLSAALRYYTAAEEALRVPAGRSVRQAMLSNRWQVRQALGDADGALADLETAADLALPAGGPAWLGLLSQAVTALARLGRADQLGSFWERRVAACRAAGAEQALAQALGEAAVHALGAGQLDRAGSLLAEQEAICRRTGDLAGLASCVGNQAIRHRYSGDPAAALACLDEQLALVNRSGDAQGMLIATANRGEVLGLLGRIAEARASLLRARELAIAAGLTPMVAQLDQMIAGLADPAVPAG
jgi:hypothetical protein